MAYTKIDLDKQSLDQSLTANKIKDGIITDVKIASDANISISKLDTTNADFNSSGKLKSEVVSNANIASDASISFSKMAAIGANKAVITDASGHIISSNVTSTEVGYLSGVIAPIQDQINSKLSLSGGTMSGQIDMQNNRIKNVGSPIDPLDAVTKQYVDSRLGGLSWQEPVKAIIDEANLPTNPTIGDRYLINNGTHVNTIAEYTDTGWIFISPSSNWAVFEQDNDQGWVYNAENTDNFKWVQFTGTGMIDAGIGLEKVGNILNVKLGAGIKEMPNDEIGLDLAPNGGLELTNELTDGQLKVKFDNVTLGVDNNGFLYLKDNAVTTSKIADTSITASKLGNIVGNGLIGSNGSVIQVDAGYTANKIPQYSSNGYLGIGKTNPTAMLDVNGDIKTNGNIFIGGNKVSAGVTYRQKFYGDGIEDTFILSNTPLSANDVFVYVNGLLQASPEDYSVSGNQVIFVTEQIPPADSIVQIIYKAAQ
jgi:hypothetical protein